jgi:SAM-dependent methyltransferase
MSEPIASATSAPDGRYAEVLLALAAELGVPVTRSSRVLDFGSGEGRQVYALRTRGVPAFGADIRDRGAAMARRLEGDGFAKPGEEVLRVISLEPYRLPFDDKSFDVIFSSQVLEHVQDWTSMIGEIDRVLAPGGVAIHIFPSRYRPIEAHVFVPFASLYQGMGYLSFWAWCGIRKPEQEGMHWRAVARENHEYLTTRTHYLRRSEMLALVRPRFARARFAEAEFIRHSYGAARRLRAITRWCPPVARAFSGLQRRVLVFRR